VFLCIVFGIAAWALFRDAKGWVKQIPLIVVFVFMLILEIIKQWRAIASPDPYPLGHLPFNMSSYFLLWFGFAAIGWGRVREMGMMTSFCATFGFIIGFFIQPSMIVRNSTENLLTDFDAFHSYFYHLMFIQFFIFIIALDLFRPRFVIFMAAAAANIMLLVLSLIMAHTVNVNFFNFLGGTGVLAYVSDGLGLFGFTVLLFVASIILSFIAYFGIGLPYDRLRRKWRKKEDDVPIGF